jgi:hypothetical protein
MEFRDSFQMHVLQSILSKRRSTIIQQTFKSWWVLAGKTKHGTCWTIEVRCYLIVWIMDLVRGWEEEMIQLTQRLGKGMVGCGDQI